MLKNEYSRYADPRGAKLIHAMHDTGAARCAKAIRAFAATLPSGSAAIPKGWKLVPEEPTRDMKLVMCEELDNYMGLEGFTSWNQTMIQRAYHAMLAAAPSREGKP